VLCLLFLGFLKVKLMYYKSRNSSSSFDGLGYACAIVAAVMLSFFCVACFHNHDVEKFSSFELKIPVGWELQSAEAGEDFEGTKVFLGVLESQENGGRRKVVWNPDGSLRFFSNSFMGEHRDQEDQLVADRLFELSEDCQIVQLQDMTLPHENGDALVLLDVKFDDGRVGKGKWTFDGRLAEPITVVEIGQSIEIESKP